MNRSHRFLLRMIGFLVLVIALAAALGRPLFAAFMGNPAVNGVILGILVAGIVYFISQNAGVAFDERAIGVVNFSDLSSKGKKTALKAANEARCSCGC